MNRCYNCKFWATQDDGYSNWTVMGTTIHCMKKHFEATEESYSWNQNKDNPENDADFFKQAETCPDYKLHEGTQVGFDVDGEITVEDFKEDKEVYEAAKEYFGETKTL